MNDATPLRARLEERFWRAPDAVAQAHGWQIGKTPWGGRQYRDPRFDQLVVLRAEVPKEPGNGGARPPGGFAGGHPRHHPEIPRNTGLLAVLGMVWRWRVELGLAGAVGLGVHQFGAVALAVLMGLALPPIRRAGARLVVRHRFQGLCLKTAMRTREGWLPLVMSTASTPDSTLLLLWCRSGMSAGLFEDYVPEIKVACFAADVAIFPHYRWPHLLTVELRRA
ncbi:hypothetical protein ACIBG8_27590 [Nonomuraea sp. NPDC050556]|uniref:hypothetical protein n=1 Tax=Nonomuraea sp. NPDC050556 TaxID=3364369 RepID=UPI003789EE71